MEKYLHTTGLRSSG